MIFASVIVVDWSARSTPSPLRPSKDSIWIGRNRDGVDDAPLYCRTRAQAVEHIIEMVAEDRAAGRHVLVGFDFAFGWPAGFAHAVTGEARALALWSYLAAQIDDGADNSNNRYAVAEALNKMLPGTGPFWSKSHKERWEAVPYRNTRQGHGLPDRRQVEHRATGAKTVWQLAGAGSVGSQALIGVARLQHLRHQLAAQIWPFETAGAPPDGDVVFAEVYPGLFSEQIKARMEPNEIPDRAQVRVTAAHLAALDRSDLLQDLMNITALGEVVHGEEGWILGVPPSGAPPVLRNDCFALPPGVHWTPVATALSRLREGLQPIACAQAVDLGAAGGRILAEDVVARCANPAVANSAVDGYAFRHDGSGVLFIAAGRAAAGAAYAGTVPAGHALRILTGAALPAGCDTVVLDEDVTLTDGQIRFGAGLRLGANVRRAGEDFAAGATLVKAGRHLTPADLALIAAGGIGTVTVRRPLRVAILSTGDELVASANWSEGHSLPDANRPMLADLLRRWGMEVVDLGIVPDQRDQICAALDRGAEADAILTTGGASAGDEDHISAALSAADALQTWRIAVKPGRPLALGLWSGTPVFGLPGNPVAALVCALIFARPALLQMAGADWSEPEAMLLPAAFSKRKKAGRREYLRARLRDGQVEVYPSEGSGRIAGLSWAEGLCELPDGAVEITPGMPVRYLPWGSFGL